MAATTHAAPVSASSRTLNINLIDRPDPRLMRYYFYCALLSVPAFPLVLLAMWFRYITLRYKFDDDGVSMSHGVLFRREINLTYRRIQDIHVTRNILQRWMGLATISLQTASGSAQAEMKIEGILQPEQLRDYLYSRMRGSRNETIAKHPLGDTLATVTSARIVDDADNRDVQTHLATGSPNPISNAGALQSLQTLQTLEEIRDALQVLVARKGERL